MYDSNHITDWDIQALVDDELAKEDATRVQSAIKRSQILQNRYQHHLHQKKLLQLWHKDN